jgi:hypothetical protein
VAGLFIFAPAAVAVTPTGDIGSAGGPLTHVYIGNDFSCQINHTGDAVGEFYPSDTVPGDCGTFLATGGTLYGPDFASHGGTATGGLNGGTGDTLFSSVNQSAVTGSGTSGSPRQVTTTGDAGSSGLHVSQTDSYVDGNEYYRTDVTVSNSTGSPITGTIFHAGDCYLQGSDVGYGWYDSPTQSIFCTQNPNNSPPARILGFQPITSGSHYTETDYSTVWGQITQAGTQFPDMCDCTTSEDNGAGLSWAITVPANGSTTVSFLNTFSPTGVVASTDQPISASGSAVSATEGKSFSGTVATFTDPDTSAPASEYSASINWGDGHTSAGTISGGGGSFSVSGTHTYAEEGSFPVKVTITDVDNTPNSATTTVSHAVADAPVSAVCGSPESGPTVNGTLATFTDRDPAGTTSDYVITINWGDGHTTGGSVSRSGSHFNANGNHTYVNSGAFSDTVTIRDKGGASTSVKCPLIGSRSCARPSGHLTESGVGKLSLGETRQRARRALSRFTKHGNFDDYCLRAGFGERAGYPGSKPLSRDASSASLRNRIVLLLTANPFYRFDGIKHGSSLGKAKRNLNLGRGLHIGLNWWYFSQNSDMVVKVRGNTVLEIGPANSRFTQGHRAQLRFLKSFGSFALGAGDIP